MDIRSLCETILDEGSTTDQSIAALDEFARLCSELSVIQPDRSFDAWAEDSLLPSGVAINPQAAAHCVTDYQRTVVFIRGIHAAIISLKDRFPNTRLEILYAGCGPFATLLMPLLSKYSPGDINLHLLDIHQRSLDSVELLLRYFDLQEHATETIQSDACEYQHQAKFHLIITETMQKSLEQEPQFAVTANLAPQLIPSGIFIPQQIEVRLCLADLEYETALYQQTGRLDSKAIKRYPLATVCNLSPLNAFEQVQKAKLNPQTGQRELDTIEFLIPDIVNINQFDAALFTHIVVFEQYELGDFESEISLPLKCHELAPLNGGRRYKVNYQLGSYPKFNFERLRDG